MEITVKVYRETDLISVSINTETLLRDIQNLVGGYVEIVYPDDPLKYWLVNEEGLLKNLPVSKIFFSEHKIIMVGNIVEIDRSIFDDEEDENENENL